MSNIERVCRFLDAAKTYYLATVEGDQPRVRPFGTALVYEDRLYIQTGKAKSVSPRCCTSRMPWPPSPRLRLRRRSFASDGEGMRAPAFDNNLTFRRMSLPFTPL